MALLQYKNIVDYAAQQAAFETFLEKFKTSPEQTLTHAIGQINIDEDDLSDEYDFMDRDDEEHEQRRREKAAAKLPKHKYADLMQKLADRTIDEVLIELDDIAQWEDDTNEGLKLVESIEANTKHYVEILSRAIDKKMPAPTTGVTYD